MESTSSKINVPNRKQSSKRLLFDRRYGWVVDEWKAPAEEALDGGRGMFCIVPLAKALVKMASQSRTIIAIAARNAFENPQLPSHQMLQSALDSAIWNFMSLKNTGCQGFTLGKNCQLDASSSSSHTHSESDE